VTESDNKVTVNAPFEGRVTWVNTDVNVSRNTLMLVIQNPSFITLQKEYLEARNAYEYYKDEYTRQGDLTVENATSIKKMQTAKKDYQAAEISLSALALQLKILGITPDSLKPETIHRTLPVYAARTGSVSRFLVKSGDYVSVGASLFEISEHESKLIKFEIPEQYYMKIKAGQLMDFKPASDTLTIYKAEIRNLSGEINPVNHMATGFARISGDSVVIIPGMSVKALIYLNNPDSSATIR
jgi:cobalt-zinc-cadmium efflux system membrane fusion protein